MFSSQLFSQDSQTNMSETSNYLPPADIQLTFKPLVHTVNGKGPFMVGLDIGESMKWDTEMVEEFCRLVIIQCLQSIYNVFW